MHNDTPFYNEQDCEPDHDYVAATFYTDVCRNCGHVFYLLTD